MPWVKLYTEMLDEFKLLDLDETVKWRFVQFILLAGECDDNGYITSGGEAISIKKIAMRLRIEPGPLQDDVEILTKAGLLSEDVDTGALCVVKFEERQDRPQKVKREQWRESQRRHRSKEDNVIDDSSMSHTPRVDKIRVDKIKPPAPNGAEPIPKVIKPHELTPFEKTMERLEKAFASSRGCDPPDWTNPKAANKRWRTPIAQIYKACGDNPDRAANLIQDTVERMYKDQLTFDAPDQILKTALAELADQRKQGRGAPVDISVSEELAIARRKAGLE
jgi:hypothetical protein